MTPVLGIDPGGKWTGIVLRDGPRLANLVGGALVTREPEWPIDRWVRVVCEAVERVADWRPQAPLVCIEGLNDPTPHLGLAAVRGLIDTAHVRGALLARWAAAVDVPPGKHGSGPLAAYPEALRPQRGKGRGQDRLRHVRAAWDVAGAGAHQHWVLQRAQLHEAAGA